MMKDDKSTSNDEIALYRKKIESIADQLCVAVKGNFNFSIKIDTPDESIQKLSMLINFVIDTAQRALSNIEEKNIKLTELDKLKSDFMANISHELRTPLTLILGPLEEITKELSTLNPKHHDNLRRMHRNALRLYTLVNDLLDFSKLEAGKFEICEQAIDLNALISEFIDDTKGLANKRNISLTFIPCENLELVLLDKKMIEKITLNLVSNALKFTPPNGQVTVSLKKEDNFILLTVKDTGIGIAKSKVERLFERFYQADSSQTRSFEGTGIGLALVNQFTLLLKGKIYVESEQGMGSTFTVALPIKVTDNENITLKNKNQEESKSINTSFSLFIDNEAKSQNELTEFVIEGKLPLILIAEDNQDILSYLSSLLKNTFEIISVNNGKSALDAIYKYYPKVILSDVMMPIMDGYELTKKVTTDPAIKHIPIILITAKAGKESLSSGLKIGAYDYLCKPFSAEELLARTENALRSHNSYIELLTANKQLGQSYEALEASHQELKSTKIMLLQQAKLAAIGQLAAGIAHEINNPIAFVKNNTEILHDYFTNLQVLIDQSNNTMNMITESMGNEIFQSKLKWQQAYRQMPFMTNEAFEIFSETITGLGRVTEIVKNLKSFAAPQEGKLQEADINNCLDSTLKIIHNSLKYKCDVHKQYGNLPLLKCFPNQLTQVFTNILINATQAIKEAGDIVIKTEAVNNNIIISITDSGEGINPEDLDKLFEPFFTTKPIGEGTGLGLAISYSIVQKHGGYIEANSNPGEGTTFTIYLPLHENQTQEVMIN